MNKFPLVALTASLSLGLIGCSSEEEETATPFDWTISEANAKNVVAQILDYEDGEGLATDAFATDTNTGLKVSNGQKFFSTPEPVNCEVSGTVESLFTGTIFTDFTWDITFASCKNTPYNPAVSGVLSIANTYDIPSVGDVTGMIDLNLTSQGFTISGDIDSTTYSVDSSTETSFALSISATVGGSLSASTGTNFVTYFGDLYPSVGELTITGPLNNSIIVTAIDNTYVEIEVDMGSDGNIESTETVLWSSL